MKEIFTRNDGVTATVRTENGFYTVELSGKIRKYKNYGSVIDYIQTNGFSIFLKKIVNE